MSTRKIILALVALTALLLTGAVFVWPSLQRRGLIVRDNAQDARTKSNRDAGSESEAAPSSARPPKPSSVISSSTKPVDPTQPRIDASKLEEGEVLVRAKVSLKSAHGLDIFRITDREPWTLCVRFTESPEYSNDNYFSGEASGQIEARGILDELPIEDGKLKTGAWSARICWNETEAFVPIPVPKYEGRVLDLGSIEFDLNEALDPTEWLIIGRLMHTTGIPITGFADVSLRLGGPEKEIYWLGIHSDGGFALSAYEYIKDEPAWLLVGDGEEETERPLGKPRIEGRIVDFGEITLDCAVLEFHLADWPDSGLRRQRHGIAADAELEPLSLWISVSNFTSDTDISLPEPDGTVLCFLRPGPYRWSARQSDSSLAFRDLMGEVNLPPGKLTRIELSLEPAPCILARFKAARPLEQLTVEIFTVLEPGEFEPVGVNGVSDPARVHAIANPDRVPLHLVATARGYQPVTIDTAAGATECLFEFTQILDPQSGRLVVLLPKLPERLKEQNFRFAIALAQVANGVTHWQDIEHINRHDIVWGAEDPAKLRSHDIPNGVIRVVLRERDPGMGYPGGIVCGPVEATIESDKLTVVRLPELPAPPWAFFSNQTRTQLTCDAHPMSYHGPVCVGENTQVMSLYHNQNLTMPLDDYAIMDGSTRVPLQVALPDAETNTLTYYHEFPARIEVRVKRGKEIVPLTISARISINDGAIQVSGSSDGRGMLRLWSPLGKASLTVDVPGWQSFNREIDVSADLKAIEFELTGTFANLIWDERYSTQQGMPWLLQDANGVTLTGVGIRESSLKIEPGRYTLVPQTVSKPEVAFELGGSADVTVHIPFVAALDCSGSFLVRFPKDLKPDPDGYAVDWRWHVSVSGDIERDLQMREYMDDTSWNRTTAEGVKFMGLPVGVEIMVVISVASLDDEDNVSATAWAIAPMRLKLKGGPIETIAVEWKRAAVLSEDWFEGPSMRWSGPAAGGMIYTDYWRVLLPGNYELSSESESGAKSLNVAIKLEEGKHFAMPPDVKKSLLGEETPDEGGSGGD